jgi:hypothetical protein
MEGHDQGHCSDDQDHTCQGKPFLPGAISGFPNPIHLYCKRKSIGKSSDSVRILNTLYACGSGLASRSLSKHTITCLC